MKKEIILFKNADMASIWVANYFDEYIKNNPKSVLGFATGVSPLLTYKLLKKYSKEGTNWEGITAFNLDEFIGVPIDHPESFRSQMMKNLFNGVNIKKENIFLPNGLSDNPKKEAKTYEKLIKSKGGIDLQYISLGANGHMAYNEPGTSLKTLTHVAKLEDFTRKVLVEQKKFSSLDETPVSAITVGVKTIMKFKGMIMVALGDSKAEPTKKMLEGPITSDIPSSALQKHKNTVFVLDEASSKLLDLSKFDVEDMRDYKG